MGHPGGYSASSGTPNRAPQIAPPPPTTVLSAPMPTTISPPGDSATVVSKEFRQRKAVRPEIRWDHKDVILWMKLMIPVSKGSQPFQGGASNSSNTGQLANKRPGVCWKYNDNACKFGNSCRFKHECGNCGGRHPGSRCYKQSRSRGGESSGKREDSGDSQKDGSMNLHGWFGFLGTHTWVVAPGEHGYEQKSATPNPAFSISTYDVTSRSIYVQWSKVSGAASYKITATPYLSAGQPSFAVFNPATVIGTVNTLLPNTNYTVLVEAMDTNGNTIANANILQLTAPEVPIIDKAYSKLSNSITVEWPAVPGAASYQIIAQAGQLFYDSFVTSSPGTVTGLLAATNYKITVRSINSAGKSQPSPPKWAQTVLAAPSVSVASLSSDSVSVSWQPVPSAVLYSVSVMRSDGSGTRYTLNTTSLSLNFTSLDPSTVYTIKVDAWDANGTPGDDATKNQITRPAAPSDLQIAFNSVALEATFSVPGANASSNYTVLLNGGNITANCTMSLSACTIPSLQCGTNYAVSLVASNEAGSTLSPKTWSLLSVPCAPSGITVVEDNPGNLTVAWSQGNLSDYYVVFVKSDDGIEVHCNTSQSPCYFPTECGFTYFMSVFAYNKAGQSPLGELLNYTTAPCCPSDITAAYVSSDTLEIVWSAVRGAEMYETKADDGTNVILCNDTATVCALSGLQCDTRYNVTVFSFNEIRGSNTSCASTYMTTAPCSPQITILRNISASAFIVEWTSHNSNAEYTVTAQGQSGIRQCNSTGISCTLQNLLCGSKYMINMVASTSQGKSLPSYSQPLQTAPCCPENVSVIQVTQSVTNVSWSDATGAQTYTTMLTSPKGQAKCHTLQDHCLLGCITCGTSYSVSINAVSETGLESQCTYHGYSSSACCPSGVKLYRLSNTGIRVSWRASSGSNNYTVNIYGSKGNFTCNPSSSFSYCDVTEIPCGDVYTVVVSPVSGGDTQSTFCPQKIYSVTCSGSSLGMVIYRGKRSVT
ncbi:fibronectin type III domain-containing protein 7 [Hyperolius riggenbachi]|uniref:fibronectin type III domain-containing protein 7 n=1 Tax=Hyperolius riggenbachi TaxID=752182 RepID=UPI0035A30CD1